MPNDGVWPINCPIYHTGYLRNTKALMEGSKSIQKGYRYCFFSNLFSVLCLILKFKCGGCVIRSIEEIAELFVVGRPDMTIVAFGSDVLDIFEVNDIMSSKGWHLNALQRPNR